MCLCSLLDAANQPGGDLQGNNQQAQEDEHRPHAQGHEMEPFLQEFGCRHAHTSDPGTDIRGWGGAPAAEGLLPLAVARLYAPGATRSPEAVQGSECSVPKLRLVQMTG
ncbi:MAG: hypothetical protein Kow006_25480 [Gammaproteobacteria bacterium]